MPKTELQTTQALFFPIPTANYHFGEDPRIVSLFHGYHFMDIYSIVTARKLQNWFCSCVISKSKIVDIIELFQTKGFPCRFQLVCTFLKMLCKAWRFEKKKRLDYSLTLSMIIWRYSLLHAWLRFYFSDKKKEMNNSTELDNDISLLPNSKIQ